MVKPFVKNGVKTSVLNRSTLQSLANLQFWELISVSLANHFKIRIQFAQTLGTACLQYIWVILLYLHVFYS